MLVFITMLPKESIEDERRPYASLKKMIVGKSGIGEEVVVIIESPDYHDSMGIRDIVDRNRALLTEALDECKRTLHLTILPRDAWRYPGIVAIMKEFDDRHIRGMYADTYYCK